MEASTAQAELPGEVAGGGDGCATAHPGRRARLLGAVGVPASGLGALGAIHSGCHAACSLIIASLAVAGVSVASMPLAFLLDPTVVIALSSVGIASVALSLALSRRQHAPRGRLGRARPLLLAAFGVLSVVSLALGVRDVLASGAPAPGTVALVPAAQQRAAGDLTVGVRFAGRAGDALRFDVTADTANMQAPPLSRYDLRRSTLAARGPALPAGGWKVLESGHMGHHLKGRLTFPAVAAGRPVLAPGARAVLVLRGLGARELRFAWRTRASGS